MDVPGEDMQIVAVREKDAEEMERLKMMIYCDNSQKKKPGKAGKGRR